MKRATDSAVIVTAPAVEPAVAKHRARLDRAAAWGVPAHVTVLYPFVPPSEIDARVSNVLAAAIASVPAFSATCSATGWFDTDVLWLDPQPADRFQALITAVMTAFPAYPAYSGEYEDLHPHITIGQGAEIAQLRAAEEQVLPHLPIRMSVTAAALWCGTDAAGSWQEVASFPLGVNHLPVEIARPDRVQ